MGNKSCFFAVRELGYNVADNVDTIVYLTYTWTYFVTGNIEIEEGIKTLPNNKLKPI